MILIFACQFIPVQGVLNATCVVNFGDRIAQLVPHRKLDCQMQMITDSELRDKYQGRLNLRQGGFGHSGVR